MSSSFERASKKYKQPFKTRVKEQDKDDLLIVYALALLAHEYRGMEKEDWALNLAAEIADQHGLVVSDAIRQFE